VLVPRRARTPRYRLIEHPFHGTLQIPLFSHALFHPIPTFLNSALFRYRTMEIKMILHAECSYVHKRLKLHFNSNAIFSIAFNFLNFDHYCVNEWGNSSTLMMNDSQKPNRSHCPYFFPATACTSFAVSFLV
jgi:hypothetical protein